jgi:NagD protein
MKAFSLGKPSPIMMRAACDELDLDPSETAMIGDTMETDILGGIQLGMHTVLVLSGGTREEDVTRYAYRPELIVDSLGGVARLLNERDWQPVWQPRTPGRSPQRKTA